MSTFLMMIGFLISAFSPVMFGLGLYKPKSVCFGLKNPDRIKSSLLSLAVLSIGVTLWFSNAQAALEEIEPTPPSTQLEVTL